MGFSCLLQQQDVIWGHICFTSMACCISWSYTIHRIKISKELAKRIKLKLILWQELYSLKWQTTCIKHILVVNASTWLQYFLEIISRIYVQVQWKERLFILMWNRMHIQNDFISCFYNSSSIWSALLYYQCIN